MRPLICLLFATLSYSQTITTLQTTTTFGASRPIINTNFTELNTYTMKNRVFNDLLMISPPSGSPASGYLRVYAKTDSGICWKTSAGAETCTGAGVGDVTGPASAVADNFTSFNGTGGKTIKDSGSNATTFAVAAKGVTNGDTHDHAGGDGAQIAYGGLSGIPSTFAPSSHASNHKNLGSDEVATATPAADQIVKAEAAGTIALGWIPALPNSKTTATSANTPSAIITRDGSGNFAAGTISAALAGNAATVTNGMYTTGTNTPTGYTNFSGGRWRLPEATFVSSPGTPLTGQAWLFTDAISAGVCTGGGTAKAQCRWTGSAYEAIGGGGGGGGDAYLSANQSWTGRNSWTPTSNQAITAAGNTILCDGNVVQVTPSANLVLTSTPHIAAGTTGQLCVIVNLSASYSLTFQDESLLTGSTLRLFSGAYAMVRARGTLVLRYNATHGWVQEAGSTGGGSIALADFTPTAAGALLVVQGGRARIGNYAPVAIALGTATFTAGSGDVKVFIDQNNNLVCHMATGIAATTTGSMACSNVTSPAYPANSIPIADLAVAATTFYVTIDADDRAVLSTRGVAAGTGIEIAEGGGVATVGIDTDTVPMLGGTNVFTGAVTLRDQDAMVPLGCGVGDPAGSALATGVLCHFTSTRTCTIKSWDILIDAAATVTVKFWRVATGGSVLPTASNSITSTALSTGGVAVIHSATVTEFSSTAITQFDRLAVNLESGTPKYIYAVANCN